MKCIEPSLFAVSVFTSGRIFNRAHINSITGNLFTPFSPPILTSSHSPAARRFCSTIPSSAAATARNGLGNIRRRAAAMNGEVTLTSQPGAGTRVHLKVHFPPRPPRRREDRKDAG